MMYAWLAATLIFAVVEACTLQLISIWFAGGALAAFVCAVLGTDVNVQWIVFAAVSALLLAVTKPVVKKLTKNQCEKTNIDAQIGKITVVTKKIDNIAEVGEVKLNGLYWSARSEDGNVIEADERVRIKNVEGVKLIVEKE